ncbi:MAG TPA: flagellar hook-associated protein FlgL [Pseudomonadales bacterium]
MRISTSQINQHAIDSMLDIARQVNDTRIEISSGRRVNKPSDDPVGAARIVKLKQELALRTQYNRNIDSAEAQLRREEAVLQQVVGVLHRVRELMLSAGSGVKSADDRRFIATEIESRFNELADLMNTRSPTGDYLFAGYQSKQQPFTVNGDQVTYHGDDGRRTVQVDAGHRVAVTDSGRSIFMDVDARGPVFNVAAHPDNDPLAAATITSRGVVDRDAVAAFHPDGLIIEFRPLSESATGSPNFTVRRMSDNRPVEGFENVDFVPDAAIEVAGMSFTIDGQPQVGDRFTVQTTTKQDVLTTVRGAVNGLLNLDPAADAEAFEQMMADTLAGLDNAMNRVLEAQVELGGRLNTLETTREMHSDLELQTQEILSDVRDLDVAEAVSRLAFQSFVLEAVQQSYVRVSRLSLFNRL